MTEHATDNAGVIAPPPILFAGAILAGVLIDLAWPLALLDDRWQYWIVALQSRWNEERRIIFADRHGLWGG